MSKIAIGLVENFQHRTLFEMVELVVIQWLIDLIGFAIATPTIVRRPTSTTSAMRTELIIPFGVSLYNNYWQLDMALVYFVIVL